MAAVFGEPAGGGSADRLVVTVREAARLLGVGETTLREHLGEIPHVRLGRRILIRRDALLGWLEQRERAGEGA